MARLLAFAVVVALVLAAGLEAGARPRAKTATCSEDAALRAPPAGRPSYLLTVSLASNLSAASGMLRVAFEPEVATDRLVFRLWPNGPAYASAGAHLVVEGVQLHGKPARTSRPDATTLVVHRRIAAGQRITVSMRWRLALPRAGGGRLYGGRVARLGSFFPLLAWTGGGWATDPPIRGALETWTSPAADFDVRIAAPSGMRVLATGTEVAAGRWRARAVRDFAVTVGRFAVTRQVVRVPAPVEIVVGRTADVAVPRSFILAQAAAALRAYSKRYGAYPWRTYTVAVTAEVPGSRGIEYPTIVFLIGDPSRLLVGHETAHQWFYSLVGNDQARDPWLDEALTTWAEVRHDDTLQELRKTPIPKDVRGRLGQPTSFWDSVGYRKAYFGIYVQGAQALASLGDPDRVDCALRRYVAKNAYRTAVPRDLLRELRRFFPDARTKLERRGARF